MKVIYKCFPEGKFKVLTMSYDDGREPDKKLIDIFNNNGIKGTFHLNSGLIDGLQNSPSDIYGTRIPKDKIKKVYEGHEISCHTMTHPTIARSPMSQIVLEVTEDRKELEYLVGYPVRGLSYPNGSYNEEIKDMLKYVGIEYARIVGNSECFSMPKDYLEWKATCHHNYKLNELADQFIALNKRQYMYMFYVWGHSYEFVKDDNWSHIEGFCKKMGRRDDIWYATNIEIIDYMKAFDNLKFSMDASFVYNPSIQSVWLSVDGNIVEVKGGQTVYM
ncbi:polysaccharide deacetylase family protein [Clostridium butyricum]|uniref:polysaccharide deacetylase family protein n=1 Tax=Clostridium butyricum TaxID=1492 RepID=UPI003F8F116C